MPAYNRALDLMALAAKELRKGNLVNASTLMHRAAHEPSLDHALRMVDATNAHAMKVEAAAKVAASAKVTANEGGFEETDDATMALLNQQEPNELEDATGDLEAEGPSIEVVEETAPEVMASAKAFANALVSALKSEKA